MLTFGRQPTSPFFACFTIPYTGSMNRHFFIPAASFVNVRVLLNHLIIMSLKKSDIVRPPQSMDFLAPSPVLALHS